MADRRLVWLLGLLAFIYLRTLSGVPLDWDDDKWLVNDPILTMSPVSAVQTAFTTAYDNVWAPALRLSFAAQLALFGGWVPALHLVRIALFLGSVVGLHGLLRRLGVGATASLVAVSLWALHPTKVEPVAWLTGLKDVQSLALSVAAARLLLDPARHSILGGTALGIGALLTKAATFPLPLLLFGIVAVGEGRETAWRRLGPWCIAAVAAAAIGAGIWTVAPGHPPVPWSRPILGLWVHGSLWTALWPVPRGAIVALPPDPWPLVALGLAATGLWAWVARSDPRWRAALAVWLAPQIPFLGLATMAFWASDRHVFVASLGPALLAGWAVERAARRWWLGVALVFAVATWWRVPAWHDEQRLWEADLACPGEHWARWYKAGMARAKAGAFAPAAEAFERSLALYPSQPTVVSRWVLAKLAEDGFDAQERGLVRHFQATPADAAAWRAAVDALRSAGRPDLAAFVEAQLH